MARTKPKALGTKFETAVVRYMREMTGDERIERRALHGARDMGDIHGYIKPEDAPDFEHVYEIEIREAE